MQDPGGRITTFAIDAAGDLAAITDASGSASFRATYTPEHLLSTRSDGVGNVWELRYDFSRRVESLVSPTVLVDGAPRRPVVSYRSLESAMLYGAGHGTLAQPRPRTSSDSLDAMVRVVGPRGFTTSFALGRFGAPLLVIEPGSRRTRLSYDEDGRVVRTRSPAGRVVRQRYQGPDLVERWDSTAGARVTLAYEPEYHQLTQLSGDVTPAWHFWSRGRLDSTRAGRATDSVAKFTYDARNRLETMTDPAGHTTRIGYMTVGSLNTSHAQTTGMAMTSYQYDALGRLISKASDGVARGVVRYDALDRPRLTVGALGDTTRYGYGPAGLDTVIDASGQRYLYRRNALGWVESEVDPAGRAVAYRYDAAGNVVEMINRRGQSVRFTYDALDLVRSRTADEQTTTYSVDTSGFFASATNGESTDTVVVDALGRKTREIAVRSGVAYELSSGYDARGRRTQIAVARPWSSTVGYHYNEASRLDELTDIAARKTTLRYDTDLLELQRTLPNNVTIGTGGYFSGHMPRQLDFTWRADLVSEFGAWYRPTPRGELADRWKRDSTGAEYQYDASGQLTRIAPYWFEHTTFSCPREDDPDCIPPVETRKVYGTATTLQYDAVGNPRGSGVVVETGNRLRRLGDYQLEYDADGNLTRKYKLSGSGERVWDQTLSWNSIGQLTTVTTNGSTVSFGYDGWGRRVRKTGPSGMARYLWDGDDLFAEVDATGNRVAEYTYYPGIDQPHSMRRSGGGQLYYYATERPGHVVALLDASGSVVDHYEYSPFGELTVGYGTVPNTLRYGAREHDVETGLYYNRARYYDPALRRFVSEDPLGLQAGINQYAYAGNAPLDARDPTGLCKVEQMVLEVGADGVAQLRCPEGQEYELRPSVITAERDYFAEINTYVKDLMSRTDKLREEAASAVVRRQQDFANAIYQARDLATVQSLVFMMTVDRLMQDPWYSTRTCWASLQQRFAKETVKGALGGIVTAAARNYSLRAPLKQGVGAAGTGGAAVGLFFAIDGVEAACQ
jgi:RHS repeat-associated protein